MRIAFLCLAHNNENFLSKLSSYYCSDEDEFIIHLDKGVREFDKKKFDPKTKWVEEHRRKKTAWGTFEIVSATIELLKSAKELGEFDRYILISGVDVPLVDKITLKEQINNEEEYIALWEYIERDNLTINDRLYDEFFKLHFYNILNYGKCRGNKVLRRLSLLLIKAIRAIPYKHKKSMRYYAKGSQWWCISNKLVDEFLSADYSEYKYMHAPDEKAFHTILVNSNYRWKLSRRKTDIHGIHYIDWNSSDLEFRFENIDKARSRKALFARKIYERDKDKFINYVKELHVK
ncbi:beta-1,6-N-acetylglucosaminyltransferase [Vibrio owensii]|uniref:hypothetical protein n=1 Tax=Vibrio owensii TaxID=696485 RepID=UPI002F3F00B2